MPGTEFHCDPPLSAEIAGRTPASEAADAAPLSATCAFAVAATSPCGAATGAVSAAAEGVTPFAAGFCKVLAWAANVCPAAASFALTAKCAALRLPDVNPTPKHNPQRSSNAQAIAKSTAGPSVNSTSRGASSVSKSSSRTLRGMPDPQIVQFFDWMRAARLRIRPGRSSTRDRRPRTQSFRATSLLMHHWPTLQAYSGV
jgi:hypothetical protein